MNVKKIISAIAILSMTQGCSIVRRELRHSGGFAGDILDRRMFDARTSKRLQLLRFTMVIALASRVGSATIRDAREAEAFVSYLQNASEELNFLAAHLYGQSGSDVRISCFTLNMPGVPAATPPPPPPPVGGVREGAPPAATAAALETTAPPVAAGGQPRRQCDTYEALFESDIPQLEYKIVRLVLMALPQRQAGQFLRSARSGNILGAAWHFLKLAAAAADGFHRAAAVYRSSQEILAIAILTATNEADGRRAVRCATRPTEGDRIRTVEDAAACLGLSPDDLFDNPREADVRFPRDIGEEPFQALYEVIRTSCGLLPIEVGLNSNTEPAESRRKKCAELAFSPRLRFGGRTSWEAINRAETPQAPVTGDTAAEPVAPDSNVANPEDG